MALIFTAVYQEKDKSKWTKDGRSWYFRCYYNDIYGNNKQKESKKYLRKKDAEEAERIFLTFVSTNTVVNYDITFEELYNEWFLYKSKLVKFTTAYDLKVKLKKHMLAFFKDFRLHSIKVNVINQWYDFLSKSGLNLVNQNKIIGYLREILSYARENYDFDKKIIAKIVNYRIETVDRIKESEWNFWTYEEFKQFISTVDDELYFTIFNFMHFTGLRIGEMIALTWKDIDLNKKTLNINKNYTNKLGTNSHKIVDPKTKNSIRIIDLDDNIVSLMKKHFDNEKQIYGFNDDMNIFGNVKFITPTTYSSKLNYYIKKVSVKKLHHMVLDIHMSVYYSI